MSTFNLSALFSWLRTTYNSFTLFLLILGVCVSCKTDYQNLPAYSESKQLQVVIQTPAGSNHPQTFDPKAKEFVPLQNAGLPEAIKFLPFPGNFGFIPSTELRSREGFTGKPLEALVLAERVDAGTVQETTPIATLILENHGEIKYLIIAVPSRPSEQIITATDYTSLIKEYPAAKEIIQKWFINAYRNNNYKVAGWKDEKFSEQLIQKWLK